MTVGPSRTRPVAAAVAAVALGAGGLAFGAGLVLHATSDRPLVTWPAVPVLLAAYGVFAAVGYLVATRRPGNPIGWLLVVSAALIGVSTLGYGGARQGDPRLGWLTGFGLVPTGLMAALLFLLFPDGRPPGRRWQPLGWAIGVATTAMTVGVLFAPGLLFGHPDLGLANPYGIDALPWLSTLAGVGSAALLACVLASVASLVVRWRRAGPVPRRQLKWLALAGLVVVLTYPLVAFAAALGLPQPVADVLIGLIIVLVLPAAVGIALLRHRLLDIDLVLRRSLVFAGLWLGTAALLVAVAELAGRRDWVPSLLLAAAAGSAALVLLYPARRRVSGVLGRWVFGPEPSRYTVVAGFSAGLGAADPGQVAQRLATSAHRGLAVVWTRVRLAGGAEVTAGEPAGPAAVELPIGPPDKPLGTVGCGPRVDGVLSEQDVELLRTLAGQAALALSNAQLAARLVHAQEQERRRIERNLHDGVQQQLVALGAGIGLAAERVRRGDLAGAGAALDRLRVDASAALRDLRELAAGIHPSVLADGGLAAAVAERCADLPVRVALRVADPVAARRYPDEIEGAAYFLVMEAVTNALKHAEPAQATVALTELAGVLTVAVGDDGRGFDPTRTTARGLAALADRVAALGGTFAVDSQPGAGTTVTARLPVVPEVGR